MAEQRFLFIDTETTGLPTNKTRPSTNTEYWPRLVSFAWILCTSKDDILEQGSFLVKPNGYIIPKEATQIHKITTARAVNEGITWEQARNIIDRLVSPSYYGNWECPQCGKKSNISKEQYQATQGNLVCPNCLCEVKYNDNNLPIIVGHNVDFDIKVIESEYIRHGDYPNEHNFTKLQFHPRICTMNDTHINNLSHFTLQDLYLKLFGHVYLGEHNAVNDVKATFDAYWMLIQINLIDNYQNAIIRSIKIKEETFAQIERDRIKKEQEQEQEQERLRLIEQQRQKDAAIKLERQRIAQKVNIDKQLYQEEVQRLVNNPSELENNNSPAAIDAKKIIFKNKVNWYKLNPQKLHAALVSGQPESAALVANKLMHVEKEAKEHPLGHKQYQEDDSETFPPRQLTAEEIEEIERGKKIVLWILIVIVILILLLCAIVNA